MFVIVCWCFTVCCIVIPSNFAWLVFAIAVSLICNVMLSVGIFGYRVRYQVVAVKVSNEVVEFGLC